MSESPLWRKFVPCTCTVLALCAGVCSIVASASPHPDFQLAARLILVSLILGGLGGGLARSLHGKTEFCGELDTFMAITSFGIAPALLLYFHEGGLASDSIPAGWGLAVACLVVISGASRLSRFRVEDSCRGQRGTLGLPITGSAGFAASYVMAIQNAGSLPSGRDTDWLSLSNGPLAICFWGGLLLMVWLQVSRVRYGKPTKTPRIFIPLLVLLSSLFISSVAVYSAALMFAHSIWYAFVSPFFFRRIPAHLPPIEGKVPAVAEKGGEP